MKKNASQKGNAGKSSGSSKKVKRGNIEDLLLPPVKSAQPPEIVSSRKATIDFGVITKLKENSVQAFSLELLQGKKHVCEIERFGTPSDDSESWSGSIQDTDGGNFTLVNDGSAIYMHAVVPSEGVFSIRPAENGLYEIVQINPEKLPECGISDKDQSAKLKFRAADPHCSENPVLTTTVELSVLVIYTAAARTGAGGQANIDGLIRLCVDETNQTFTNSQINARLRLAFSKEVSYTESGVLKTDLGRLQNKNSGYFTEVHSLRDTHRADMVCLLVENADAGGRAFEMSALDASFERYAFGVVHRGSADGNYAFTHELGHIMGASHDLDNGGPGLCSYSYGTRWTHNGTQYKSMMAYRPGLKSLYFTNPNVRFNGNGPVTSDGVADNARTVRITAPTVSKFR